MGGLIFLMAAIASPSAASAGALSDRAVEVETPEEEDVLDNVPWVNPAVLPRLVDVGLVHEAVEDLIPDVIDEWVNVSIGSCSLSVGAPSRSPDSLRVVGSATYSCTEPQTVAKLTVCIQRRVADRWEPLIESCRPAVSHGQAVTSNRTSGACTAGTWRYRLYAAAAGVAGQIDIRAQDGPPARITCHTLGA